MGGGVTIVSYLNTGISQGNPYGVLALPPGGRVVILVHHSRPIVLPGYRAWSAFVLEPLSQFLSEAYPTWVALMVAINSYRWHSPPTRKRKLSPPRQGGFRRGRPSPCRRLLVVFVLGVGALHRVYLEEDATRPCYHVVCTDKFILLRLMHQATVFLTEACVTLSSVRRFIMTAEVRSPRLRRRSSFSEGVQCPVCC